MSEEQEKRLRACDRIRLRFHIDEVSAWSVSNAFLTAWKQQERITHANNKAKKAGLKHDGVKGVPPSLPPLTASRFTRFTICRLKMLDLRAAVGEDSRAN